MAALASNPELAKSIADMEYFIGMLETEPDLIDMHDEAVRIVQDNAPIKKRLFAFHRLLKVELPKVLDAIDPDWRKKHRWPMAGP